MAKFTLPHQHGEKENVDRLYQELSQTEHFSIVADVFKQLSDPTRIRIFWLLSHQEECVCNIAAFMDMSSPAVSHHLRSLHECGLISSRRKGKEVYYRAIDTKEGMLLHQIVEQVLEITCPEKLVDYCASRREVIERIHDYLIEHLPERITIEELSKQFLMNPTTLKKEFKEVYGMSIAAHMKKHRMELAAAQLIETQDSIAQIALSVGYENQSRFTTAFKNTYQMLPTEYRSRRNKKASAAAPESFPLQATNA